MLIQKIKVNFIKTRHNYFLSNDNFVENFNYGDICNHQLFSHIIEFLNIKNLKVELVSNFDHEINCNIFPRGKFKINIFFYIVKLIDRITFKFAGFILWYNRLIIDGFYSAKVNIKICAKFMIIPFNINSFLNAKNIF